MSVKRGIFKKNLQIYPLFIITIIVAFCSIIYELLYAELLTVLYGGSVARYSIVIGLYLLSLGAGSFCFKYIGNKYFKTLVFVELFLAFFSFSSLFFMIYVAGFFPEIGIYINHIPVLVVGFLSGLEIPLLASSFPKSKSSFSDVLGFDYVGSLLGTILYALFLYPVFGLIKTMIFVAFLNFIVAFFIELYYKKSVLFFKLFLLILLFVFIFLIINSSSIQDSLKERYLINTLEQRYTEKQNLPNNIRIVDSFETPYQQFSQYVLLYGSETVNKTYECFDLNNHLQGCDIWIKEYHKALVDIPVDLLDLSSNTSVLVLGGGDWIVVNNLQKYGFNIDLVELDKKFSDIAKTHPFISPYHNNSFEYENLTVIYDDAFNFVKETEKTYDLIILDLPGLENSKMLYLYSEEFFISIRYLLSDGGVISTWTYAPPSGEVLPEYSKYRSIFTNTLISAGYSEYISYIAGVQLDDLYYPFEEFLIISKNQFSKDTYFVSEPLQHLIQSEYLFVETFSKNDAKVNSVFSPNLKMVVEN